MQVRSWTRPIVVAMSLITAFGGCCETDFPIVFNAPPELNPKIRLDHEGLDIASGQDSMNPFLGPFRNGDPEFEIVSELFPDLGGDEEKLLQSNCFWISNPVAAVGDFVKLSWEAVVTVDRAASHLDCSSPARFGLCRLRDPVDGRWIVFHDPDEDAPLCPGDSSDPSPAFDGDDFSASWLLQFEGDLPEGTVSLGALKNKAAILVSHSLVIEEIADGATSPHRQCPGDVSQFTAFAGSVSTVETFGTNDWCWPDPDTGYFTTCGERCLSKPTEATPTGDVTYRIRAPSADLLQETLQPNVMSVRGTASLTRPMSVSGNGTGSYFWQTGFTGGESAGRWHENFSPLIRVERVRIYRLEDGVEKPVTLAPSTGLQVIGSTSQGPVQARTCQGQVVTDGVVFDLFPDMDCDDANLLATPTYLHRHLTETLGPLSLPLSWSITTQGPVSGAVFIEFSVVGVTKDSMALSITSPHDFGRVSLGEGRRLTVTVENIGGEVAVIDAVYLAGPEAAEFSFVLPSDPRPLPLPVTAELGNDELTLSVTPSLGNNPAVLSSRADVTNTLLSIQQAGEEGATRVFNGFDVEYESGLAFYTDPAADFVQDPLPPGSFRIATPVYARRSPPFELLPGESFEALVTASPSGYNQRLGELHVGVHQLTDPTQQQHFYSTLLVDGVVAPYLDVIPRVLGFPAGVEGARTWWRGLLVTNPTTFDIDRSFQIAGPDAALFEFMEPHDPLVTIESGGAEVFRIRYLLPCPGANPASQPQAEFRLSTASGTEVVALYGFIPPECVGP